MADIKDYEEYILEFLREDWAEPIESIEDTKWYQFSISDEGVDNFDAGLSFWNEIIVYVFDAVLERDPEDLPDENKFKMAMWNLMARKEIVKVRASRDQEQRYLYQIKPKY